MVVFYSKYVPSMNSQLSCFIMVLLFIFCVLDNSPPLAEQCCAVCKDCDKEYTEMTVNEIINGKVSEYGIYCKSTKLREVMFSIVSVYQSFCPRRWGHVIITHDAFGLTIQGPPLPQTCSNSFNMKHAVGKWAVSILLKCLLVFMLFRARS